MSEFRTSSDQPPEEAIGSRIRDARELLEMSQDDLARLVALPRTALSAIENGKRQVTTAELLAFARVFDRPFDYFLRPPESEPFPFPRQPSKEVQKTLTHFEEMCRSYGQLEEMNGLTPPDLPRLAFSPGRYVSRDAERLAELVRTQLGLGPALPARQLRVLLDERYGIKTFVLRSQSRLSGACLHHRNLGPCVLVIKRPTYHMLFTLAHQLAHLLVHRETPFLDEDIFSKTPREQFASAFAAALIMPRAGVQEMFFSFYRSRTDLVPADVAYLARHFGTSRQAMLWRLQGLRLIAPSLREALCREPHVSFEAEKHSHEPSTPWSALPERHVFLAARAYQQEKISMGRLAELLYDEEGRRRTADDVEGVLADYQLRSPEDATDGDPSMDAVWLIDDQPEAVE